MRQFTDVEIKLAAMIAKFDKVIERAHNAMDRRQLTMTLSFEADVAARIAMNGFRIIMSRGDDKSDRVWMTFDLIEYHRYLRWLVKNLGMSVGIDGTLYTHDGLPVPLGE